MKHYLENHKFYVVNDTGNLVYKVGEFETYGNTEYILINLELVAGWDYVNPDENDIQGWVSADNFVEDIQFEDVTQYFIKESMEEALEANGYTVLEAEKIVSALQRIIDKHNEA